MIRLSAEPEAPRKRGGVPGSFKSVRGKLVVVASSALFAVMVGAFTLVALVSTLLMGVALVYLGEHYILDLVVGGLFVTVGWGVAVHLLDRRQNAPTS